MQFSKPSARGFTVIELLSVIGIMLIITAIATPSFYYWLPTYRLSSGARQVAADLQLARMKAISQNTTYRLNFISVTQYQLERDAGFTLESGPFTLPDEIEITAAVPTQVFQSRGTASGTQTITLEIKNSNPLEQMLVCIKTVGRVHIEKPSDGC